MLQDKNLIVFSDDWGRHPFSCQHLMQHFLKAGSRILWVNTIGLRTPRLTPYDIKRSLQKITSWLRPKKQQTPLSLPPNLRVIAPVMLPFNNISPVRAFNRSSVVKAVQQAITEWSKESREATTWRPEAPIIVATVPNAADYLGLLNECLAVYYCVDDFTLWPGMNQPEMVRGMEEELLRKADLIVATSSSLQQSRTRGNTVPKILTHGVDIDHFSKIPATRPPQMEKLGKPIVGFYGLVDLRLDANLVRALLQQHPDWKFVFIGNSLISLDDLNAYPNFHHVPAVDYHYLPDYASCFDVAILPYKVNEQTTNINPLKLREYIATGKAVVSTPLPESVALEPAVSIAADAASFAKAIEKALQNDLSPEKRRTALTGATWADKAHLLSDWITLALKEKS